MNDDLKKKLASLKDRAEKATPGPWHTGALDRNRVFQTGIARPGPMVNSLCSCEGFDGASGAANAAFIAEANPQAVLALIAEIESAYALLEYLTGSLGIDTDQDNDLIRIDIMSKVAMLRCELAEKSKPAKKKS